MHRDERVPLVALGTPMAETVMEMTGKRFGCVGVTGPDGRLAGIVTDGDLRRAMGPDLMSRSVDAIMTRRPTTVRPETLAAEALALLNEKRRSVLIVVDAEGRPVGIVHLHDLYAAGIA